MRYVGRLGARQSSAGSVTYVCFAPGTGLLRTCNTLRIASLPVLRNVGQGLPCPAPCADATHVQTPIPSVEGCRPQAAGWFPPQDATHVLTLVSDI
ncbi:MAG: hypothetical protein LBM98_00710 [Oscillospiraceae bacterium]|nr:hypothetical protein [Oscillospiraceae bacterium]